MQVSIRFACKMVRDNSFACSVQWPMIGMLRLVLHRIETQDVLFGAKNVKRVVEIGASNVLAVMAQRTLNSKFGEQDAVRSIQRQILTWTKDAKQVCYEYEAPEEPARIEEPRQSQAPPAVSTADSDGKAGRAPEPARQEQPRSEKVAAVADAPLTPTEILRAIIAHKLGKPLTEVKAQLSIKDLAGGKFGEHLVFEIL